MSEPIIDNDTAPSNTGTLENSDPASNLSEAPISSAWNDFYPKSEDSKIPDQLQHIGNIAQSVLYQAFEGRGLNTDALGRVSAEQAQKAFIDSLLNTPDDQEAMRIAKDFFWYLGVTGVR